MRRIINYLFVEPTNKLFLQLFRYGFVGGIAFVVDYGTLYIFTEYAGFHYLISAAIAFVLGLVVNYLLSISWVFNQSKAKQNRLSEFLFFAIIGVVGLGLNEIIIYIGADIINLHYMLSKLISTAIVFFFNFFARKFLVFDKVHKKQAHSTSDTPPY